MSKNRLPTQALQYEPKGRRNIGRPRKNGKTNLTLRVMEQPLRLILQSS